MATQVNDFVNSKSMLTPGLAGGLVMFITNAIDLQFGCGVYLPHFVLGFSFLTGIVVFVDQNTSGIAKFAFYVVNSFIIFAVASGTNAIGTKTTDVDQKPQDEIKATLKPIATGYVVDGDRSLKFRLVQQRTEQVDDELETKKKILQSQIVNTSTNIQLIQNDLVTNQKKYNDPKGKFNLLKKINEDLANVNLFMKADTLLTKEKDYQEEILNIQENLQKLQGALIIEKKNQAPSKKFFKAWF